MSDLTHLQEHPHAYSLFAALRVIERCCAQQPRLGESRKAADDAVRRSVTPALRQFPGKSKPVDLPAGRWWWDADMPR